MIPSALYVLLYHLLFLIVVRFRLTETDYRSSENELQINAEVSKNLRIANPVTFLLTPYTVEQAASIIGIDVNVPADNNPFSPNRAQISECTVIHEQYGVTQK